MTDTALDVFKHRLASGQTSVLVFYRGERSFFCRQWLRRWLTIPALERRLELADVVILFTSSQSQGKAFSVADQIAGHHSLLDRRLFFFGDPEHLLVNYLIERGISKPIITNPDSHRAHGWVFDYGMVQPAIVAITSDSAIIYDWTSKPSILNVAGKLDRPDPWDVWDCIERRLDRIRISKARASRLTTLTPPDRHYPMHNSPHSPVFPQSTTDFQFQTCPSPSTPVPVTNRLQSIPANSPKLTIPTQVVRTDQQPNQHHQYQHQHQHRHQHHYCDDEPCHRTNLAFPDASHPVMEPDTTTAPRSTSIDTLVYPGTNVTLLQEDLDISQTNLIADVRFHDISARISALANDILAEETTNTSPNPPRQSESDASNNLFGSSKPDSSLRHSPPENCQTDSFAFNECQSPKLSDPVPSHVTIQNRLDGCQPHAETDPDAGCVRDDDDDDEETHLRNDRYSSSFARRSNGLNVISNTTTTTQMESDLEPLYSDDVKSHALKPDRRLDLFERQLSSAEPLETSVASAGSDQVDSTTITMKHASIRTDDSSQLHSMQCDSASFSSDRRILEEADDCEPGVADHLRELKDPSLNPHLQTSRREESDHFPAAPRPKSVDRSITEPQTVLMNVDSLDVTTATPQAPYIPTSQSAQVGSTISHLRHHLTSNGHTGVSSSAGIENTMPLSTNLLESSTTAYQGKYSKTRPEANTLTSKDTERHTDVLGEQNALASLRDEYEAYDEYIVCEYQVEEHVEEFESDSISRSRGFMTTVMQEGGPPPRSSSLRDLHHGSLKEQGRKEKDKEESNRQGGSVLAAMSSAPTLSPGVEARVLEWRHSTGDSMGGSQMRKVLRKFKVPIMAVRRKVGGKGHHTNSGDRVGSSVRRDYTDAKSAGGLGPSETYLSKKDSNKRGMLRKRPPHSKVVGSMSPSSAARPDNRHFRDSEGDEQSAKVGRKETLRSVFRRIPMPKHRRRASTGEGAPAPHSVQLEDRSKNDVDKHFDPSAYPRKSNSSHSGNKTGTLQAVLQRLPSLSGTSRDQRISVVPDLSQGYAQPELVKEVRTHDDVQHGHTRELQGNETFLGRDFPAPHSAINERSLLSAPAVNPPSSGAKGESLLPLRNFGGDVWVAGLDRVSRGISSSPHTPRQRSLEKAENETARRLEFRASTSRVTSGDDSESGDDTETGRDWNRASSSHRIAKLIPPRQGRADPANYDSDDTDEWRRRQRSRQSDMNVNEGAVHGTYSEGAEKLGPKLSFAMTGDRTRAQRRRV